MTILKKGECHSAVAISSSVYVCSSCGHTDISKSFADGDKKCPKCGSAMSCMSTTCEEKDLPDNS